MRGKGKRWLKPGAVKARKRRGVRCGGGVAAETERARGRAVQVLRGDDRKRGGFGARCHRVREVRAPQGGSAGLEPALRRRSGVSAWRARSGSYDSVSTSGALAEQEEVLVTGLRMPLLVAPALEAPSDMSELQPRVLPNLRLGEELVVVAKRSGNAPFNVTLRGRLNGAAYALTRPVTVESTPTALPFAARLWAQSRIRELETASDAGATKELVASPPDSVMSRRIVVGARKRSRCCDSAFVPPRDAVG